MSPVFNQPSENVPHSRRPFPIAFDQKLHLAPTAPERGGSGEPSSSSNQIEHRGESARACGTRQIVIAANARTDSIGFRHSHPVLGCADERCH